MVSWNIGRGRVLGPAPFFVVGILNVTPDSFYDGGQAGTVATAVERGSRLLDQGADVLDIGGESTRPFAAPVSTEEEMARVLPVVQELRAVRPEALLSIDTTKAVVAAACLREGVRIVNDVSAWRVDPELLDVVLEYQPGYVLMHSQGNPRNMQIAPSYEDVVGEICAFFEQRMEFLIRAGLPEEHIVLDPGIGFGKDLSHNIEILRHIERFSILGRPIYMALSNKSLWKALLGRDGAERNAPTLAATTLLYTRGVRIHRVHEVRETRDALKVAETLFEQEDGNRPC